MMSDPLKFTTAAQLRRWLERHHDKEKEVWIAFAKKGSGKKSITYQEALDEALCFGWVDNLKKRLDDDWYLFRSRRSEEHTSELQSPDHLVCRLLLEKKKILQLHNKLITS